ncbi:xanthine dehydrogenase accessory protein XdhC [Methylocapsa sp. S129]|uniref:xanthine dehydrogenase accessory protein XdhC n=1 Tax=Methylocapsa sp. S129 TaxID=1641869 RepID=UPI00131E278C|nr:xanthine dehydrogenase accessory protein XdhC [Methylocapsa sp. S129]
MQVFNRLIEALEAEGAGALISLVKAEGSSPRESGARMVVRPSGAFNGTIGGGALEWEALEAARLALAVGRGPALRRTVSLGPDLAQCCGGRVQWLIETFDGRDESDLAALAAAERAGSFVAEARQTPDRRLARSIQAWPGGKGEEIELLPDGGLRERFYDARTLLYLFGAGHVGRALILALAPLPFRTHWIDPRREAFPERAPANVAMVHAREPAQELAAAPDGAQVLVMTHSHPLDLAIVSEALGAERFSFVGLIGSATKRARFLSQMRAAGLGEEALARLVCPIGLPGVEGKEPAVIAAAIAAQLLIARG